MSENACCKCHVVFEGDNYCHDCGCCWRCCSCGWVDDSGNDWDWDESDLMMDDDDEW